MVHDNLSDYIGAAVNYYKNKKGYTNLDLAIYLDVSEGFIKKANSGAKSYSKYKLWKLSKYLDVSVGDFFPPYNNYEQFREIKPYATKKAYQSFIADLEKEG